MENDVNKEALDELVKSIVYLINMASSGATKIYDGIIISNAGGGLWNVKVNGKTQALKPYGSITPSENMIVKVIIPEGNYTKAFFF